MKIGPFTPPDVREAITIENQTVYSTASQWVPPLDLVIAGIRFRFKEHYGIHPVGVHLRQISPFLSSAEGIPDFEVTLRRHMSPFSVQEPVTGNMFVRLEPDNWTFQGTAWKLCWHQNAPGQLDCDYYCSITHAIESLRLFLAHHLLLHRIGLLLHASAAIYHEKTYVFLGRSGAGKSLSVFHTPGLLLADESVILRSNDVSGAMICGTPFGGEHFPSSKPGCNPHFLFVEKSNHNSIKPIPVRNAVARLLSQVSIAPTAPPLFWDRASEALERVLDLYRVEILEARKDGSFWEECL